MQINTPAKNRSRIVAITGVILGLGGSITYYSPVGPGFLGIALASLGFALGVASLFLPPRTVWLSIAAVVVSSPVVAFVLLALALGIRC